MNDSAAPMEIDESPSAAEATDVGVAFDGHAAASAAASGDVVSGHHVESSTWSERLGPVVAPEMFFEDEEIGDHDGDDDEDGEEYGDEDDDDDDDDDDDALRQELDNVHALDVDERLLHMLRRRIHAHNLAAAIETAWLSPHADRLPFDFDVLLEARRCLGRAWKSRVDMEAYCDAGFPSLLLRLATGAARPVQPEARAISLSLVQWLAYRCAPSVFPHLAELVQLHEELTEANVRRADARARGVQVDPKDEYAETELHSVVTTFLNLALSLQRPEDGLDELRARVTPILTPESERGCIFSELTIVLVNTREELARRFALASVDSHEDRQSGDVGGAAAAAAVDSDMQLRPSPPLLVRLSGALEAALDPEFVPFEGLFWSTRSPCMALEKLASITGYREAFASSGVLRELLAIVARSSFTCVDDDWEDLHAAQRCASRALWWLAFGEDPSAAVNDRIEQCLEAMAHGGARVGGARVGAPLLECLLTCGLDTLFLVDALKTAARIPRAQLLFEFLRCACMVAPQPPALAATVRVGCSLHREEVLACMRTAAVDEKSSSTLLAEMGVSANRKPLSLRELARHRLRVTLGARVLSATSIGTLPPVVERFILFEHRT